MTASAKTAALPQKRRGCIYVPHGAFPQHFTGAIQMHRNRAGFLAQQYGRFGLRLAFHVMQQQRAALLSPACAVNPPR